jgi:multidrug resistance protein, MATE family
MVMAIVNLLNITLSWLLVGGHMGMPELGVNGAAVGASVSRAMGGVLVIGLLLRGRSGLRLQLGGLRLDRGLIRRILRIGMPVALDQLIFRLGMLAYMRTVAALGTVAFAAHQVALNAESISFMPGFGFAVAATTLVGQGLGARDPERAQRDVTVAFYVCAGLMSALGVLFLVLPEQLIGFFTSDPEVIAQGVPPLRLVGVVQPFLSAMMVFAGALRGAGDTLTPMCVNGAGIWLLRVPLAWALTRIWSWGLLGVWIAMSLDMCVRGTVLFMRFRLGKWKTIKV